jgi:NAD(P)-dependent dehydrogenase (short-subunit alcohol dehydrogenase family)
MDDLEGKVAVVTGGASGIGRALVEALLGEGMKVVVADVEATALEATVAEVGSGGADVIGVQADVTDIDSVNALADAAYAAYGKVHILCNNAGVGPPSSKVWESTPNDWRWTFGVNVFGVANGAIAFVPRMIAGGEQGLIINTSSTDGPIAPMPSAGVYAASKSAVTTLTECLDAQLVADGTALRASVFYPSGRGLLATGLWTSDRNRPAELARERPRSTPAMTIEGLQAMAAKAGREVQLQPLDELAQMVVRGIKDQTFMMIMSMEGPEATLRGRLDKIVAQENPTEVHEIGR